MEEGCFEDVPAARAPPVPDVLGIFASYTVCKFVHCCAAGIEFFSNRVVAACQLYADGVWSQTGDMSAPRYAHRAVLLQDGTVLAAGKPIIISLISCMQSRCHAERVPEKQGCRCCRCCSPSVLEWQADGVSLKIAQVYV